MNGLWRLFGLELTVVVVVSVPITLPTATFIQDSRITFMTRSNLELIHFIQQLHVSDGRGEAIITM